MNQRALGIVALAFLAAAARASGVGLESNIDVAELEVRRSVARGLQYVMRQQRPDGSFHAQQGLRIGVTGLCGLSLFEVAGGGDSNERSRAVDRATAFLLSRRDASGVFRDAESLSVTANHAFAVRFLAAVHGKDGEKRVPIAIIRRACDAMLDSQGEDGGWHHGLEQLSVGDVTNTACVIAALDDCRRIGLDIHESVFLRAASFAETCRTTNGGFGYRSFPLRSDPACTANAEFCIAVGGTRNESSRTASSRFNAGARTPESPFRLYGDYFREMARRRGVMLMNGPEFETMRRDWIARQRPDGAWDDVAGTEFGTALALLILRAASP